MSNARTNGDAARDAAGQPASLPASVLITLRNGMIARLRPALPSDLEWVNALFGRVSPESLQRRFFAPKRKVQRPFLEQLVAIDGVEQMTYLITRGEGEQEEALAVGNYVRLPKGDTAEVAFLVDDAHQGNGLGTMLLERLAEHAARQGIAVLIADVLMGNQAMLDVFRNSGLQIGSTFQGGVVRVRMRSSL